LTAADEFLTGAVLLETTGSNCCETVAETVAVSVDCLRLDAVDLWLEDLRDWPPVFDGNRGWTSLATLPLDFWLETTTSDVVV